MKSDLADEGVALEQRQDAVVTDNGRGRRENNLYKVHF